MMSPRLMPMRKAMRRSSANLRGAVGHRRLHLDRAAHGIDHARELQQQAVAGGLDDAPAVRWRSRGRRLPRRKAFSAAKRAALVAAHQPRVARDVGRHDGGKAALLGHSGSPARREPADAVIEVDSDQSQARSARLPCHAPSAGCNSARRKRPALRRACRAWASALRANRNRAGRSVARIAFADGYASSSPRSIALPTIARSALQTNKAWVGRRAQTHGAFKMIDGRVGLTADRRFRRPRNGGQASMYRLGLSAMRPLKPQGYRIGRSIPSDNAAPRRMPWRLGRSMRDRRQGSVGICDFRDCTRIRRSSQSSNSSA